MRLIILSSKILLFILPVVFVAVADAQDIKDAKYYTSKGDEFFEKGNYKDAVLNYSLAISKDDKFSMAYAYRGYAYVADYNSKQDIYNKQLDKAIQDCSTAIRLQQDSSSY